MTEKQSNDRLATLLSNTTYDRLKWIAQVFLPALATFYAALGSAWGWDYITPVVLTITALDTFLGVLLGLSKKSYENSDAKYDGALVMTPNADDDKIKMDLSNLTAEDLEKRRDITIKVVGPNQTPGV